MSVQVPNQRTTPPDAVADGNGPAEEPSIVAGLRLETEFDLEGLAGACRALPGGQGGVDIVWVNDLRHSSSVRDCPSASPV